MDAAKSAVSNILNKSGRHTTEVDEEVNRPVTQETVKPHRHEETTQAVDKEVHQDHYHTTVQPLQHKEVLPEQHTHQQMPVQEREIVHGDTDKIRSGVEAEAAKFQDTSRTMQTTTSQSAGAVATGEHVHHHVHERVQPVVNKETIQPEVVHTTVPIHETHHAQAEHHGLSTLPTKTLDEFQSLGGKLTGGGSRHEEYEGHPRPYNPEMQATRADADVDPKAHDGLHGTTGHSHVSGIERGTTSSGYTSGSTGTALGGRTEGNVAERALGSTTSHSMSGGDQAGITGESRPTGHETSTTGMTGSSGVGSTGGDMAHREKETADTSDSNSMEKSSGVSSDRQHPSQGQDPSLVESETGKSGKGLVGQGADGSHSAVFGLTPDGHKHNDTSHGTTKLKSTPSEEEENAATGDTGSRAAASGGVAKQMHDPNVAEPAHGGSAVSDTSSGKPGAGMTGGSQGFGEVRPNEHGAESKIQNKLDPTTDADRDGKAGVMD